MFALKLPSNNGAAVPVLTLFGGVIGGLSFFAALKEFSSLQVQIESAHETLGPWLDMRHGIVGGQIAAFGAQALLGLSLTVGVMAGVITVKSALVTYAVLMGPLNFLIAILGVLYLIAWYFQQAPMQNFLNYCCWSKSRAIDLGSITFDAQQDELNRLCGIFYTPRVSFASRDETTGTSNYMGLRFNTFIDSLTIDLPGAEPGSVYLDITMIGNPLDTLVMRERIKNGEGKYSREEPMQDIGNCWIHTSRCEWIPASQGQGLRLTGAFKKEVLNLFASQPRTVSLRYRTPLTLMMGALSFVGGDRGVAFTLSGPSGLVALRNDPTPELDTTQRYSLGDQQCSIYLQPEIKR